jgi:hypothetical protein
MATSSSGSARNRTSLGLVLVAVGVILTLDSTGVFGTASPGRWWPLLLVGVGIVKVRQPREDGQRAVGVAFLLLGSVLQLMSVVATCCSWPLLMVAFGAFLIWRGLELPAAGAAVSEDPFLSEMALMGYVKRSHNSLDFRGGSVTAVMGGVELDLRKAVLAGGTAHVDVVAFWGGIEIKVPAGWTVDARVVPMMGAFETKLEAPATAAGPRLVLRGYAIMGAVTIGS